MDVFVKLSFVCILHQHSFHWMNEEKKWAQKWLMLTIKKKKLMFQCLFPLSVQKQPGCLSALVWLSRWQAHHYATSRVVKFSCFGRIQQMIPSSQCVHVLMLYDCSLVCRQHGLDPKSCYRDQAHGPGFSAVIHNWTSARSISGLAGCVSGTIRNHHLCRQHRKSEIFRWDSCAGSGWSSCRGQKFIIEWTWHQKDWVVLPAHERNISQHRNGTFSCCVQSDILKRRLQRLWTCLENSVDPSITT